MKGNHFHFNFSLTFTMPKSQSGQCKYKEEVRDVRMQDRVAVDYSVAKQSKQINNHTARRHMI